MTSSPASAHWLNPPFAGSAVFCLEFETPENRDVELQIAAVPGFRLSLDGTCVAVSHLQFTRERVFLERVPLHVIAGRHQLELLLVDYGEYSPRSRMMLPRGLYVLAEGGDGVTFNTGLASWRCRRETRFSFARQELKNFQCVGGFCLIIVFRFPGNYWNRSERRSAAMPARFVRCAVPTGNWTSPCCRRFANMKSLHGEFLLSIIIRRKVRTQLTPPCYRMTAKIKYFFFRPIPVVGF